MNSDKSINPNKISVDNEHEFKLASVNNLELYCSKEGPIFTNLYIKGKPSIERTLGKVPRRGRPIWYNFVTRDML